MLIILVSITFYSCVPPGKAVFFPDIREQEKYIDSSLFENSKRVFSGDRIQLKIVTKDDEANSILNAALKGIDVGTTFVGNGGQQQEVGYLIDPDGFIEIPTLGKISVRGKTPTEIKDLVKNIISDFYKDVEVYCTIGGRVLIFNGAGGIGSIVGGLGMGIPIINERLTIVEVLNGTVPTLTKIDKIWLIRETDGIRHFVKINMNTIDVFDSPYYYLRNNDIIYLEPYKINSFIAINSPIRNLITFFITIPAIFIGIRSLFIQ
ncbi:MAG: polysaccharide biosynthesis/export family protein [Chitinophagaceae bacterium]|nr:polysaccharide biosynthesis/export family protein [Chitinophagaceae bacterium]